MAPFKRRAAGCCCPENPAEAGALVPVVQELEAHTPL